MPGSVANAAPATTLPVSLCTAFSRSDTYPMTENMYPDGTSQRVLDAANSRKRWSLSKRLTPTQLSTLRAFYEARKGQTEAFYFYDPYETSPKFDQTPSGTTGRYTVRFDCPWEQWPGIARADVSLQLVELA
jgi:hypothetical protein